MTRAERAIKALRAPDASLSRVAIKAEAALREIEAIWFNAEGLETNDFYQIGKIARTALEGK
jgi:hypothetical protein